MLLEHDKPTDAPVPVNAKRLPAGVLVDSATNKRIPFPRKVDMGTGEVEYLVPAANGVDVLVDPYTRAPYIRKYKAVGKLVLVPMAQADKLGVPPPRKVESIVQPMTKEEKIDGMREYQTLFFKVWNEMRGEADRCVKDRWDYKVEEFVQKNHFLDSFVLKSRRYTTGGVLTS